MLLNLKALVISTEYRLYLVPCKYAFRISSQTFTGTECARKSNGLSWFADFESKVNVFSLFFWFVYFTLDDLYKVKAVFMSPVSSVFKSYCSKIEYWPQKHVQSGNIHSMILDVYVEGQSTQNFLCRPDVSFLPHILDEL